MREILFGLGHGQAIACHVSYENCGLFHDHGPVPYADEFSCDDDGPGYGSFFYGGACCSFSCLETCSLMATQIEALILIYFLTGTLGPYPALKCEI